MLLDTTAHFVFGIVADSTYFDADDSDFGEFYNINDTLYAVDMRLVNMSAGDSCTFNIYWGDKLADTKTDSLFDAPEPIGAGMIGAAKTLTIDDPEIPPEQDVWMERSGPTIANVMPNKVGVQLNVQTRRD